MFCAVGFGVLPTFRVLTFRQIWSRLIDNPHGILSVNLSSEKTNEGLMLETIHQTLRANDLQLFSEVEVNSGTYSTEPRGKYYSLGSYTEGNNCLSICLNCAWIRRISVLNALSLSLRRGGLLLQPPLGFSLLAFLRFCQDCHTVNLPTLCPDTQVSMKKLQKFLPWKKLRSGGCNNPRVLRKKGWQQK